MDRRCHHARLHASFPVTHACIVAAAISYRSQKHQRGTQRVKTLSSFLRKIGHRAPDVMWAGPNPLYAKRTLGDTVSRPTIDLRSVNVFIRRPKVMTARSGEHLARELRGDEAMGYHQFNGQHGCV